MLSMQSQHSHDKRTGARARFRAHLSVNEQVCGRGGSSTRSAASLVFRLTRAFPLRVADASVQVLLKMGARKVRLDKRG